MQILCPLAGIEDKALDAMVRVLAPVFILAILALVLIGALKTWMRRRLLDTQIGIDSIRRLGWKELEVLLSEYYRRRGYHVEENIGRGADGGVDLRIAKNGSEYLVQCKQWQVFKVGVSIVREMYGLMVAESAAGVFIVTSGKFTAEARAFAEGKPITLVEGDELVEMIRIVQTNPPPRTSPLPRPAAGSSAPPPVSGEVCPKCGKQLVRKTARKGAYAGKDFWACPGYPACKYVRNIDA